MIDLENINSDLCIEKVNYYDPKTLEPYTIEKYFNKPYNIYIKKTLESHYIKSIILDYGYVINNKEISVDELFKLNMEI